MVPKLHAKGSSFKGAAAYLLHDKDRADTSERVSWVETRNLAVDDPQAAWRIMAATALDQARLKAEAGVKSTGRKSDKHVLHLSLAWHPDQKPSREEMAAAADGALKALGAGDRQAMIVAHDDEAHAHVHVLINRVSPEDGKHLPSSNDRLKLSKWAEAYERQGGRIYCEDRVVNNAMRAAGEYVKGPRDAARHIFEAQRARVANDNLDVQVVLRADRAKDAALALRTRNAKALHGQAWDRLDHQHRSRRAALGRRLAREIGKARAEINAAHGQELRDLLRHQRSETETFEALEASFFGRAGNVYQALKLTGREVAEGRSGAVSRAFQVLTNAGKRRQALERSQEAARTALERQRRSKVAEASTGLRAAYKERQAALRGSYMAERASLARAQDYERAELAAAWKERRQDRARTLDRLAAIKPEKTGKAAGSRLDARADRALSRYFGEKSEEPRDRDAGRDRGTPRGRDDGR